MVLYQVHSEPSLDRYYSTICSRATLFQIIIYVILIIPAFFIAYATNDFWLYTSTYREQPDVNYLNQLFIQIDNADGTSVYNTWSTFPNLNVLLQQDELATPLIKSREVDLNRDRKNDILHLSISFANLGYDVQSVKLLLFMNLEFTQLATVSFRSLVYFSESWATPSSSLWVGGALGMTQRVPFPASGRVQRFNTSLLNTAGLTVDQFELRNILSSYNRRNVTTSIEQPQVVWEAGHTGNFTLDLELTYPVLTISYSPGFWQLLKFAWIQYLAIFVVFWWVLSRVQSFVFQNQVILTIKKPAMKIQRQKAD